MNKQPRKSPLVMIGLPLALAILVWSLLTPSGPPPKAGQKAALPYAQAMHEQDKLKIELAHMVQEQNTLEPRLKTMAFDIPAETLRPRIINTLIAIASKAQVHLTEYKSLRPRLMPSGQTARVPLEIRFRAPFQPNVIQFLYYLEDPKNRIVVDKMNITSTQNATGTNRFKNVDVSAQISVFTRSTSGVGAGEGDFNDTGSKTNRS